MPVRDFIDANGVRWRVWSTVPRLTRGLQPDFAEGWLTFESEAERRRLAPIPAGWETTADERLALLCRAATRIARPESAGSIAWPPLDAPPTE